MIIRVKDKSCSGTFANVVGYYYTEVPTPSAPPLGIGYESAHYSPEHSMWNSNDNAPLTALTILFDSSAYNGEPLHLTVANRSVVEEISR